MYSIFVSYKFEDNKYLEIIKKWGIEQRFGKEITITSEKEDVRINGTDAIKRHLNQFLNGMAILLVLVGQDSHNRPWVDYEVNYALQHHKKIILVQIPKTNGGPPKMVKTRIVHPFDPNAIYKEIRNFYEEI